MGPLPETHKRNSPDLQSEDTPEPKMFKTSTDLDTGEQTLGPSFDKIPVRPCCSGYRSKPDSDTIEASRTGEHTSDEKATDIQSGTKSTDVKLSTNHRGNLPPQVVPTYCLAHDLPAKSETRSNRIHQRLRHVYKPFKRDIRAADVAPYLFQKNIIDGDTLEWILEEKRPKRRADILIKAIAGSKKSFTVADIADCLHMSKYVYMAELLSDHRDSIDILEKRKGKYAKSWDLSADTLCRLLPRLEKDVEPRTILDDLLSCGMLTFIDHEDIYTAQSVVDRWKTLLKCINRDLAYNFQLLYDVLSIPDVAFDCTLPSSSVDDCHTRGTVNNGSSSVLRITIDVDTATTSSFAEDQLKDVCIDLKLNGNSRTVRKVEAAIVNGSNKSPASRLQEFFSRELKASNLNISLHCVRIRIQAISSESLRLLEDALKTENGVPFVEKLLNELLTTEKIEQLRQGGTREVKLEITASKQTQKASYRNLNISKMILLDKYDFLIEEIDGGDFIGMLQDVPESTDTRNAIMSEQSRATRNRRLVDFLLRQGQTTLDRFLKEAVDQKLDYIVDLFETEPDQCLEYQEEDASTEDECVRCPKRRRLSNSSEKTCLHMADLSIQYVEEGSKETDLQLYFKDLKKSTLRKSDKTEEERKFFHSKVTGLYSIGESSLSTSLNESNRFSNSFLQAYAQGFNEWKQDDDIKARNTDMPSPPSFPRTRSLNKSELSLTSQSSGIGSMFSRSHSPMYQPKAQQPSKAAKPRGSNAPPRCSHTVD